MAAPVKLRIILGENNSQRLILPNGIPQSVSELSEQIKTDCGIEGRFRLQFMDAEFGNEFTNLVSMSDVQDKGTIKVIFISDPLGQSNDSSSSLSSCCSFDTDILSSSESTSSRSSAWPVVFPVPKFSYDTELQLDRANAAFKATGTLLNPDARLKSSILNGLAETIIKYKVYLSDSEFEDVAEALILKHPCLKEPGSVSGYGGWKASLKYKLGNYRTKLRGLGCPEVTVNALTHKPDGKCSPAYGVKRPKKAEVNYCPAYPSGETAKTLEMVRVALLSEAQKRNNDEKVGMMMDKTFALRREEVVGEAPMIADFKTRWPALFNVREVSSEFKRITTLHLQSKFFSGLDANSGNLLKAFAKKGGAQGKKIKSIMHCSRPPRKHCHEEIPTSSPALCLLLGFISALHLDEPKGVKNTSGFIQKMLLSLGQQKLLQNQN
uniref:PB1 domain-containing protein n=1 Tax=Salarias fasciatus TaxID=181472 RepID=A0A672ICZ9_SALFA